MLNPSRHTDGANNASHAHTFPTIQSLQTITKQTPNTTQTPNHITTSKAAPPNNCTPALRLMRITSPCTKAMQHHMHHPNTYPTTKVLPRRYGTPSPQDLLRCTGPGAEADTRPRSLQWRRTCLLSRTV